MKRYRIDYYHGQRLLSSENRTHETGVEPSENMVRSALHSICLDNQLRDFHKAKALVYDVTEGNKLVTTYISIKREYLR